MGVGEATQNAKSLDPAVGELAQITGQKPVVTRAKKSIAAFKVRAGMPIGAMVTLRGDRMYEFLDRLVNIVLPRVRDFRGVSTKSFDGRGNYTLGLHDQLIFPEIDYAKVDKLKGMNVTIVTTAQNDNQARSLLKHMGMPFRPKKGVRDVARYVSPRRAQRTVNESRSRQRLYDRSESWQLQQNESRTRESPSSPRASITAANCVDARELTCGSLASAA